MRVGIDARFLTHPQVGGFKTYTEELVSGLARVDRGNEYVVYVDRPATGATTLPTPPNFTYRILRSPLPVIGTAFREQVLVARQAARDGLDVLHEPCLTAPLSLRSPLVLTVHDTFWLDGRRHVRGSRHALHHSVLEVYQRWVGRRATRRAAVVVTVSHAAGRDIARRLGVPAESLVVTHEAARPGFCRLPRCEDAELGLRARGLQRPFVLALSSTDPRKNVAGLLEAYDGLPEALRARYALVVVWGHAQPAGALGASLQARQAAGRLHLLQGVTDAELVALYNAATVFVSASREEGFGLPVLEAMACGAPVIAFDNSSVPEVVGDAAVLVRDGSSSELSRRTAEVLADEDLQARLSASGMARAREFSWDRCARQTVAAYERAVTTWRRPA